MSQMTTITVYDGASTPVLHTLLPVSTTRENGKVVSTWRENLVSVPANAQVYCTATLSKSSNGVYKTEVRTVVPVMESISGQNSSGYTAAPKIAYENTMVHTGFFHERSDTAGRRLVRQLALNINSAISISVAPTTSGNLPELVDLLIAPV